MMDRWAGIICLNTVPIIMVGDEGPRSLASHVEVQTRMKLYLSQSSNRACKYLPIKISKRESSSQQRGKSYLHGHGWVGGGMEIRQVVLLMLVEAVPFMGGKFVGNKRWEDSSDKLNKTNK